MVLMAHEEASRADRRRTRAVTGAARRVGSATGRAAGRTYRFTRRASRGRGAGETGLYRLIELHAFHGAGDTAVAVALAGTLFFQSPTGEARLQVAQFLALTMLPFVIVAPLISPVLDRFGHGRRWAIGTTMALRAFLCWVLADAVLNGSMALFPAALGVLVASKAYIVTRSAAVPRLLPDQLTLVRANARISLAGVVGAAVSAPLAVLAASFGPEWALRYGFVVFVAATVLAILLPAEVDSARGEARTPLIARVRVPHIVVVGLHANAGVRLLSGFLTMYLVFLLREEPFPGWEGRPELLIGLVIGAAGLGNTLGIALGTRLRPAPPEITAIASLLTATAVTAFVAVFYSFPTAVLIGLVAGMSQPLAKLALDALIQHEVPEQTRTGAFARAETLLQLSWVVGGFVGLAMPLVPHVGLGVAAALLAAWSGFVIYNRRPRRRPVR
jgi:MFS family permease